MMTGLIGRNRLFTVVLVVSALLRLDAELGYRWQSWFNDSWDYVDTAVTLGLDPTRASGYSLYLALLRPFHSFALVTVSQHVMGLLTGVLIYALARRRFSCPTWAAVLMTLPVLFDGFEIQLEHLILSDTLFLFLVMLALTVLLWSPLGGSSPRAGTNRGAPDTVADSPIGSAPRRTGPGVLWWRSAWARCAVAGILIGLSAIVRSTGVPLMLLFGLWILLALAIGRVGWRTLVASAVAFAVTVLAPTVAYAGWFDLQHGTFNTSESTGVFLYSRVMSFADCSKMGKLPTDLLSLCSTVPPSQRPIAQAYIWTSSSPLDRFPASKFSALPNSLAQQFAIRAIEAQPLDYAKVTFDDTWRAFYWPRTVFPNDATYDEYLFGYHSVPVSNAHPADGYRSSAQAYLAGGNPTTAVVNPFAQLIRVYQRYFYLPGTIYGVLLLLGLAALVLGWRRRGGADNQGGSPGGNAGLAALLPWVTSFALVVTPAATAEFDYRYVTTAVPFACLALAMAYAAARGRLTRGAAGSGPGAGEVPGRAVSADGVPGGTAGAGTEPGGAPGLPGGVTGGGPGGGAADAGHDNRDLAPDASRRGV
jgi:hypothetical protein